MANASAAYFPQGAPSTVAPSPTSGQSAVGVDASNHLFSTDTAGNIWIPSLRTGTTAASAAINTTETVINSVLTIPAGLWQLGSSVRFTISGTCTATVGNASTFNFKAGTLGTTGDASVATWAITSAATGTNIPFMIEIVYTTRGTGAPGSGNGSMMTANQGTTGIFTAAGDVRTTSANTGPATTTATKIVLTYVSAAITTTCTFQTVETEWLPV